MNKQATYFKNYTVSKRHKSNLCVIEMNGSSLKKCQKSNISFIRMALSKTFVEELWRHLIASSRSLSFSHATTTIHMTINPQLSRLALTIMESNNYKAFKITNIGFKNSLYRKQKEIV